MEYKLQPLGFMEFFAKQRSSGSCKKSSGCSLIFMNYIHIYIYIYIYTIYIYIYIY